MEEQNNQSDPRSKRKKKGFSFKTNERKYQVYFESFNKRLTRCYIKETKWEDDLFGPCLSQTTFIGESLCNVKAGDVFDEEDGMRMAFGRATGKLVRSLESEICRQKSEICRQKKIDDFAFQGINSKFINLLEKGIIGEIQR